MKAPRTRRAASISWLPWDRCPQDTAPNSIAPTSVSRSTGSRPEKPAVPPDALPKSGLPRCDAPTSCAAAAEQGAHLGQAVTRWFTDAFREAHPDVIEGRKQRILANDPQCYAAAYRVLAAYDLADDLPEIKHESLVATGEFDQGSNTGMSRLMAKRIPNAQLRILPRMKHALLLECPHLLAEVLPEGGRSMGGRYQGYRNQTAIEVI